MDKGLLAVLLIGFVCVGLILSLFGAILAFVPGIFFSPSTPDGWVGLLFTALLFIGVVVVALSFRGR